MTENQKPHYSTVLRNQIKERDARLEEINGRILELMTYMTSEKYHCGDEMDGYINISDVQPRLEEMGEYTKEGGQ